MEKLKQSLSKCIGKTINSDTANDTITGDSLPLLTVDNTWV